MIYGKLTIGLMLMDLYINPCKSKCLLLSGTKKTFDVYDIIIDFVESASNLGVIFNGPPTWPNHINVIVLKVNDMLKNLWTVIDSTPFAIRMQLAKTFLIPVIL